MQRVSLVFMSLLLALSTAPLTAFAAGNDGATEADNALLAQAESEDPIIPSSGWKISGSTLTISGNGVVKGNIISSAQAYQVKTVIIEEGVTGIADDGWGVFYSFKKITSVSLPSTLKKIGKHAFRGTSLTSINIPDGVTSIGEGAFGWLENLGDVKLGAGVKTIGENAFASCTSLKSVRFNDNLEAIGDYAFSSCSALESVEFNEGLQTIGKNAFDSCKNLGGIKLGTKLKTIGDYAFSSCSALESVEFNEGLQTIGASAFAETALTSVRIPSTVQTIGNSAFKGLSNLESIVLLGKTAIGESSFANCPVLKSIDMPSVRTIGAQAFENCDELNAVKVGAVEEVGDYAFDGCKKLESFTFPTTLKSLGGEVFKNCSDQMTVEFLGDALSSCGVRAVSTAGKIIYPGTNATWTDDAKREIDGPGVNKLYARNADGMLTKEPYLCMWKAVDVPFGSVKSEWMSDTTHRCFDFNVPKDMKVRIAMYYMLPCYHGSYSVTLVNSTGETIYSDIAMRNSNEGELRYEGEHVVEPELSAGDYHLEVFYLQPHKGESGMFTVGVYDATPAENPKPDDPGTTDPKPDDPGTTDPGAADSEPVATETMYRLYNPNSGEHFYTSSPVERQAVIDAGWNDEGVGWTAPTEGIKVYRLYNSFAGEHHYTTSEAERDMLVSVGWTWEEGGWFSDPNESVPLYRAYNPNAYANNHHYTLDWGEFQTLLGLGWQDEGVGWHGVK